MVRSSRGDGVIVVSYSTPISCHFSLTVNPIRAAHAVSGLPGGSEKTAYSMRGSDYVWFGILRPNFTHIA